MKRYRVTPSGPLDATITPPGSRSHTNRAIVAAALARGTSTLTGVLESEDTQVMLDAWRALGIGVSEENDSTTVNIEGCAGVIPSKNANIWVAASGTTARFLTAVLTAAHGRFVIDGVPRMRQRPIADLIGALGELGADISTEQGNGCPPVTVKANGLPGGQCNLPGNLSSQYLSGMLLAAPLAETDVTINIIDNLVSKPFVEMTVKTLKSFGVRVEREGWERFTVEGNQKWDGRQYPIEPDAISATYFWGAAAVTKGRVRVDGIDDATTQGDAAFVRVLEEMGCTVIVGDGFTEVEGGELQGIDIDMGSMPDAAMTLATVAVFANSPTRV
ncbi:MAG: 3-phosphoshikimate 1-carboxyvinyltransferase, partial [Candidatus Latescibacteria bacterium]|nr:3-phosphoshikimate 1-carboxyvinyltransferase [Candidatus Latescibacterota bacterium]